LEYGNHSILTQPAGRGWRGSPKGPGPNRWPALLFAAVACAALAGCATKRAEPPAPGPATSASRAAVPAGAREFEVDPEASVVTMLVRRAGKLSGFGHVHVVTSDGETGRVWFGAAPDLSGFEVRVPVDAFVVDDRAARAGAGPEFAANVPEEARSGTRRNMLGPDVLDAARYPEIVVSSAGPLDDAPPSKLNVRIVVRGAQLEREVPVTARIATDSVSARGTFTILQSELGIKPFSVVGGAIAVADEVEIRFDIVARAVGSSR
jgi:polyisoprenoid-binding protein YceI